MRASIASVAVVFVAVGFVSTLENYSTNVENRLNIPLLSVT